MQLGVQMAVFVVLMIYFIPDTHGRPPAEVKPKQKYGAEKKLKFKQWINWIVSLDDDSSETDSLRENLASLSVITDVIGRNFSGHAVTDTSPISNCIQACFGNHSSVNVSFLHTCNRECMLNPHRFDHPGNGTHVSRNSESGKRRRRYSSKL